jgi:hypothetical protein
VLSSDANLVAVFYPVWGPFITLVLFWDWAVGGSGRLTALGWYMQRD